MEGKETIQEEDILELALCEQNHLILRPNRLYRFVAIEGCANCEELAAVYKDD